MINQITRRTLLEYKELGLTANQAATEVGCNYRTARKVFDEEESLKESKMEMKQERKRKSDKYRSFILEQLQSYPKYSSKQIYNELKKQLMKESKEIDIGVSTFRRVVREVRQEFGIAKPKSKTKRKPRQFRAVPDMPPGLQAQFDFGQDEVFLHSRDGEMIDVYFGCVILSYSRYRYVEFQLDPITSGDAIRMLSNALDYFEGSPHEVAIDQDTVMVSSEKRGNVTCTSEFEAFLSRMPFKLNVLHKSDPQSKGKVERSVGYVKASLLNGYVFSDLKTLNDDARWWTDNIANAEKNETIKEVPAKRFEAEKTYLLEVPDSHTSVREIITHQVGRDNAVWYKQNRYEVPPGSYLEGMKVKADIVSYDGHIEIYNHDTGAYYAEYQLEPGAKGKLYTMDGRKHNSDQKVDGFKRKAMKALDFYLNADLLVKRIMDESPSFKAEQLDLLVEVVEEFHLYPDVMKDVFDSFLYRPNINVGMIRSVLKEELLKQKRSVQGPSPEPGRLERWNQIQEIANDPSTGSSPKISFELAKDHPLRQILGMDDWQ